MKPCRKLPIFCEVQRTSSDYSIYPGTGKRWGDNKGADGRMRLTFSSQAWEDYLYWQKTDAKILKRINALIKEVIREPYKGLGKPEPLKNALSGYWPRRITNELGWFINLWMMDPHCPVAISLLRGAYAQMGIIPEYRTIPPANISGFPWEWLSVLYWLFLLPHSLP